MKDECTRGCFTLHSTVCLALRILWLKQKERLEVTLYRHCIWTLLIGWVGVPAVFAQSKTTEPVPVTLKISLEPAVADVGPIRILVQDGKFQSWQEIEGAAGKLTLTIEGDRDPKRSEQIVLQFTAELHRPNDNAQSQRRHSVTGKQTLTVGQPATLCYLGEHSLMAIAGPNADLAKANNPPSKPKGAKSNTKAKSPKKNNGKRPVQKPHHSDRGSGVRLHNIGSSNLVIFSFNSQVHISGDPAPTGTNADTQVNGK